MRFSQLRPHRRTLLQAFNQTLLRSLATTAAAAPGTASAQAISRVFSEPLLYRDFIQQSLYHPDFGYFNKASTPVKRLQQPLNFNSLMTKGEYERQLARIYKQLQVDWLTPVEIFAPWYGRALAHYMLELRKHDSRIDSSTPLSIVEIGGGTGTLAASILDYVCEVDPTLYSSMSYTTIEISASLAAAQQQHMCERNHSSTWRLVPGDASQLSTWQQLAPQLPRQHSMAGHTFVLMMEVLDNLPHDRVVRQDANTPWQQVAVQAVQPAAAAASHQQQQGSSSSSRWRDGQPHGTHQQDPTYSELIQPATDPLIQRCLHALHMLDSSNGGSSDSNGSSSSSSRGGWASWLVRTMGIEEEEKAAENNVWLPTRCLQLLETVHAALPQHTLIAGDFSALPDIKVAGRNAPLVSGREAGGVIKDYSSVLVPWGCADIFFPTDFDDLGHMYEAAAAAKQQQQQQQQRSVGSSHSSTAEFMSVFGESKKIQTLSGYNALLQGWSNTRIFVGNAGHAA